jgi:dTDP-glucose 4,6-dehydratase/UDP-glucose 4-epimerase
MSSESQARRRLIVLGSEGFIGQYVAREFDSVREQYEVHTADIVASSLSLPHFLIDDDKLSFERILGSGSFDLCINCTGAASVADSNQNPLRDYELNVANVARMLDAVRKTQGSSCRFLNLSSAAVYGNPSVLPVSEEAETNPISPYGFHKLQTEHLLQGYARLFGLRASSVRIFSAYGPALKKQLFWDLYRKALESETVELWGTGGETRDFIEVGDLARAIRIVCERADFEGEAINVASGEETSIESAVQIFLAHFGASRGYRFNGQVKEGDPRNWRADISKLKSMGFEPTVSMAQGLRGYVDWLKDLEP